MSIYLIVIGEDMIAIYEAFLRECELRTTALLGGE